MPNLNLDKVRAVSGLRVQSDSVDYPLHYLVSRDRRTSPDADGRLRPRDLVLSPTSRVYSRSRTFEGLVRINDGISPHTGTMNHHTETSISSRWNIIPTNVTWYDPPNHGILAEIKSQKVNLAMMLAEYRETSRMFIDAVRDLSSLYRDIRRGRLDRLLARGSSRNAASSWLLYRYGITPLVSDLQGSLEALERARDTSLLYRFRWQSSQTVDDYQHGSSPYPVPFDKPIRVNEKIRVKDIAWVQYDSAVLQNMSALGLTNPAQLAWEVIPFSFVLDWFVNVGDYLSSLDALTGASRASYTRTFKVESYWTWPTGGIGDHRVYIRSVRSLTPTPPQWEPSITWKRVVDSVALVKAMRR